MKKALSLTLALVLCLALVPMAASAAEKPTKIGAPYNLGASPYNPFYWIYVTYTAPQDLRDIIYKTADELGYDFKLNTQIDVKVDNGGWQHTSDWDGSNYQKYFIDQTIFPEASKDVLAYIYRNERFDITDKFPALKDLFADCQSWDWYKTHSVSVRARFVLAIDDSQLIFSDWSDAYVLSDSNKMDYDKIMRSNIPAIQSSEVEIINDVPYLVLTMKEDPNDILKLDAASGHRINSEVWIKRTGDADYVRVESSVSTVGQKLIRVDARQFFTATGAGDPYEVKVRYELDLRDYKQSNVGGSNAVYIYSRFSNESVFDASDWAKGQIKDADELGLVPGDIRDKNFRERITRREFAAISVLLYENLTDTKDTPASPANTFTDTQDLYVRKAHWLNVMVGTNAAMTEFSPDLTLTRQEAAVALTRVLKKAYLEGWTYATNDSYKLEFTMPQKFADDDRINSWARESVYFMVANGIIEGVGENRFAPRDNPSVEQAVNFGFNTRQEAVILALRMVENLKGVPIGTN